MKKIKIIKEIHKYGNINKIVFRLYEKFIFKWIAISNLDEFKTYQEAEQYVLDKLKSKHGEIVLQDNNVYTFIGFSLSTI